MAEKTEVKMAGSKNVKARVSESIAFGGLVVRPKVDPQSRRATPVLAYLPRAVALAHGAKAVEIIEDAPDGVKLGVIEETK